MQSDKGERGIDLGRDLSAIENKIGELGDVALVVIDPISAYLGDVDTHRDAAVRGVLAPLSRLAERTGAAVLLIAHPNKATQASSMYRVSGALAFVAAVRASWMVALDPDDPDRRLLTPVKCNLSPTADLGFAYSIERGYNGAPRLRWEDEHVERPDERPRSADRLGQAVSWLAAALNNGPREVRALTRRAAADGFSDRTLQRAAKELGVEKNRAGFGGPCSWCLPILANSRDRSRREWRGGYEGAQDGESDRHVEHARQSGGAAIGENGEAGKHTARHVASNELSDWGDVT